MIFPGSIGMRLYSLFSSDPVLVSSGFKVDLGAPIFADAGGEGPYLTIQQGASEIEPHLIQANVPNQNTWRGTLEFRVFHYEMDVSCAANGFIRIQQGQDRIFDMVNSNLQLDGLVQKLNKVTTELYDFQPQSTSIAWVNLITLTYEVVA